MTDDEDIPEKDMDKQSKSMVGYKKPPKHGQFKPGRSGNPRGRPRGARGHKNILAEVAGEIHNIYDGGANKEISTLELVLMAVCTASMNGGPDAFKLFRRLSEQYGEKFAEMPPAFLIVPGSLSNEDYDLLMRGEPILPCSVPSPVFTGKRDTDDDLIKPQTE